MSTPKKFGYLVCDDCNRTIPYQGLPDMGLTDTPKHRCGDEIRPFSRWSHQDPNYIKLAPRSQYEEEEAS